MKKEVKIAEFKARLSAYLRAVRRGNEIVVKDRETPIVRVLPYRPPRKRLVTIPPTRSLKEIEQLLAASPPLKNLKPEDVEEAWRWAKREVLDKGLV